MKIFRKTAGMLILLAVVFISSTCYAGYEFDDLLGENFTAHWMAISTTQKTFGGKYSVPMRVSTNVLRNNDPEDVIKILNGSSDEDLLDADRELHVLFILLSQGYGEFSMDIRAEEMSTDISTPDVDLSTIGTNTYFSQKWAKGQPEDLDSLWRSYSFSLGRYNPSVYDTVVQAFNFHQNPSVMPSQTIVRPIVIANVSPGTAEDEPLILRSTLRDANSNIVAYDRATWDMTDHKTAGGNQWVFVPVDNLLTDNERINYALTTEVVNHTSIRYAAAVYDSYEDWEAPDHWEFDLTREQGTTEIDKKFYLASKAQIVPGLVTVFKRSYNINEENKRPLRLFPVDSYTTGRYDFRLDHKIIFGKKLGETFYQKAPVGNFNLFEVTAFQPKLASSTFYDTVAEVTKAKGGIKVPNASFFSSGSITRDETTNSTILQHFTVNQTIPGNVRTDNNEGILPVHITLNIPVTNVVDRDWFNEMVDRSRNGERLEDTFANKYEIFLTTTTNGEDNPWNLTQELQSKGFYNTQVKVFFDNERGVSNRDNDKGIITVSFIAMLMDGTRDGVRPELSIVADHSITQDDEYIIIRDGNQDNKWNMTFFIAPAGYKDNPTTKTTTSTDVSSTARQNTISSSSSGGCVSIRDEGLGIRNFVFIFLMGLFAFKKFPH